MLGLYIDTFIVGHKECNMLVQYVMQYAKKINIAKWFEKLCDK